MSVNEEELKKWLMGQLQAARQAGARITLRSVSVGLRPKDPNWLTEWDRGDRKTPPTVDEWVQICRALREAGAHAPLAEVLVFYGVDKKELAAELEALAPYSDPAVGTRVAGEIRQLSPNDLQELEDFIGWLKFSSDKRNRSRRSARRRSFRSAAASPANGSAGGAT